MALDLTCLQTFQANSRARVSSGVGGRLLTTLQIGIGQGAHIVVLHQHASRDVFQNPFLIRGDDFNQAQIFLGGEFRFGGFIECGCGDDFEEELVHLLGGFCVDGAIHANHTSEG